MIELKIEITSDTEEHFQEMIDDLFRVIKRNYKEYQAYYIWPNSITKMIKKEQANEVGWELQQNK